MAAANQDDGRRRPHAARNRPSNSRSDGHCHRRGVRWTECCQVAASVDAPRAVPDAQLLQLAASAPVVALAVATCTRLQQRASFSARSRGGSRDERTGRRRRRRWSLCARGTAALSVRTGQQGPSAVPIKEIVLFEVRAHPAGRHAALRRGLSDAQPDRRHARGDRRSRQLHRSQALQDGGAAGARVVYNLL